VNFNLYLDLEAADKLAKLAKRTNKPRNALIRQAIEAWIESETSRWPNEVLQYKGELSVAPFESCRNELSSLVDDPFNAESGVMNRALKKRAATSRRK
jgi:hypothetical protein